MPEEPPVAGIPAARTRAPLRWVERQPNIGGSESFDLANGNTALEVPPAASGGSQESQCSSAASVAAREPEDAVPNPTVQRELDPSPLILTASEQEEPTASVLRESEPVSVTPKLSAEGSKPRQEFGAVEPLVGRRLLVDRPRQERKSRKWIVMIGVLLLAAIGGTLGYYSVKPRSTTSVTTRRGEQAAAAAAANQAGPPSRPARVSPEQPRTTGSTLQVPSLNRNAPVARDTDRQVRMFLQKWVNAEKSTNIGDLTDLYAPKLSSYFTKQDVTRAGVRAVRELDDAKYGKMIVCNIKDIGVRVLDRGHAVATFRKHWQTAGPRVLMREEQDELTLILDQRRWQIVAEKTIKQYRVREEYYAPASGRTAHAPR